MATIRPSGLRRTPLDTFATSLKKGVLNGLSITFLMVKVIVPCLLAIELIKHFGFIDPISRIFRPFMSFIGLPGEAALGLIAGYSINLYAAIAVLTPLNLSAKDITVIALILGISHSLPMETPVTRQTGVNAWVLLLVRIVLSLVAGALLNIVWKLF
jgi:spore maturation protein SpmB